MTATKQPYWGFLVICAAGAAYCPAYLYGLWFSSRDVVRKLFNTDTIQYEHVFGPAVGGFLAGVIMIYFFPDEPQWNPL